MLTAGLTASLAAAALAIAASPGDATTADTKPRRLVLMFNGKKVPLQPIVGGEDEYAPFRGSTMVVSAKWTGSATGSGYFVRISTREPIVKTYASCFRGTSCRVPGVIHLPARIYSSWHIEVVTTKGQKVVAGYQYCFQRGH